jgi:hypothetical protein
MRKLVAAFGLATLQFAISLTTVIWAYKAHNNSDLQMPGPLIICHGLSAPAWTAAMILAGICSILLNGQSAIYLLGYSLRDLFFVPLVFGLWFGIGCAFTHVRSETKSRAKPAALWKRLSEISAFLLGLYFAIVSVSSVVRRLRDVPNATTMGGWVSLALLLSWGLGLLFMSGSELARIGLFPRHDRTASNAAMEK